jgi:hypothetical protein
MGVDYTQAVKDEAEAWAKFFGYENDEKAITERMGVSRANVLVSGHVDYLEKYLPKVEEKKESNMKPRIYQTAGGATSSMQFLREQYPEYTFKRRGNTVSGWTIEASKDGETIPVTSTNFKFKK